jgi:mono/diheme cytochrome c family protein
MKIRIAAGALIGLTAIGVLGRAPVAQEAAQASRSAWDGVYTEEQAKRGRELYSEECSSCHAADLSGLDEAPALAGGAFLANWEGLSLGDLSERIRISMPPNRKGRLSKPQIADILAHLLNVNNFPTGKTELDSKTEVLKQIRVEATKPKS